MLALLKRLWPTLTLCVAVMTQVQGTSNTTSKADHFIALKEYILSRPSVKYEIPPSDKNINMSFNPFQVRYVDEVRQTVGLSILVILKWRLDDVSWDPTLYGQWSSLELKKESIWSPFIAIPTSRSISSLIIPKKVILYSDSVVRADITGPIETACELDSSNFPFDSHNCTIAFIEMSYFSPNIIPECLKETAHLVQHYFRRDAEWSLLAHSCNFITDKVNFSYTECWFTMKRESIFYVANILTPLGMMAIMTLCVFCIPADSGEKFSFIVSLFVSMAVFINFVVSNTPRSMIKLPRLVLVIITIMSNLVLCAIASSLVIRRYQAQQRELNKVQEQTKTQHGLICTDVDKDLHGVSTDDGLSRWQDSTAKEGRLDHDNGRKNVVKDVLHWRSSNGITETGGQIGQSHKALTIGNRLPWKYLDRLWTTMTHGQMDTFFLLSFLVVNIALYFMIIFI